jgi:GAF domain-containing protein
LGRAASASGPEASELPVWLTTRREHRHIHIGETAIGRAVERRIPIQIPDVQSDPTSVLDVIVRAGFRALLTVPLLASNRIVGALVVRRKAPGEFAKSTVELLQTFAAHSVLAIQNARLFHEIEEKGRILRIGKGFVFRLIDEKNEPRRVDDQRIAPVYYHTWIISSLPATPPLHLCAGL